MREVGQIHVALDHERPRVHAKGAIAHERPYLQLRQSERQAGGKHRRQAHRRIEIEGRFRIAANGPPGLTRIAGGRDHQLIPAALGQKADALDILHGLAPSPLR